MNFSITRRQFLQYCTASAAALGLSQTDLLKLEKALATPQSGCTSPTPSVIWLTGQACSGCQTSLLNRVVDVTGGYYDADLLRALTGLGTPVLPDATPNDPVGELNYVNDAADLLVGDAVRALVPGLTRTQAWADDAGPITVLPTVNPFPNGYITLEWLTTVNAGAGHINVQHIKPIVEAGGFFLLVDGSVPTVDEKYCLVFDNEVNLDGNKIVDSLPLGSITLADALRWMIPQAAAVFNVGTCSSWGGIPAGKRNKTGAMGVGEFAANNGLVPQLGAIVNLPGCPPHPDWIVFPVAYYLIHAALPALTADNRPRATYIGANCDNCRKSDVGVAECLGQDGCLLNLGCKGASVIADCALRQKNTFDNGTIKNSWCCGNTEAVSTAGIGDSRHPCQGCTEPQFPDWDGGIYGVCSNCEE